MLLKRGYTGKDVKTLQRLLHLQDDGVFGVLTEERVKEWQREHGLVADGIVGDKTWAAMTADSTQLLKSKRVINEIIVHCTATPEGVDKTVAQIRANHVAPVSKGGRGWSDIGYHYVVYRDGCVHEGRNVNISGAHCTGHNSHSIGVVYVGGLENKPGVAYSKLKPKDTRTQAQKDALVKLLKDLRKLYPTARIRGHRDFANKACPSFDATKEYSQI